MKLTVTICVLYNDSEELSMKNIIMIYKNTQCLYFFGLMRKQLGLSSKIIN